LAIDFWLLAFLFFFLLFLNLQLISCPFFKDEKRTNPPAARQEKSSPAQGAYCVTVTDELFDQVTNKEIQSPLFLSFISIL